MDLRGGGLGGIKKKGPDTRLITYAQCFWSFINLYLVRLRQSLQNSSGFLIHLFIYIASHSRFRLHPPTPPPPLPPPLIYVVILISHLLRHICMNTHAHLPADSLIICFCWMLKRCFAHLRVDIFSSSCKTLVLFLFIFLH